MNFTWLDTTILLVYFFGLLFLGNYQIKKIKSTGDFFAGKRSFNKFLMLMHNFGTGTSAEDPVAVSGASFKTGFSGIWYTFIYLVTTPFYWVIAGVFRRSRFLTTTDFFEARYSKKLGLAYTLMATVLTIFNIGAILKSTGTIATSITGGTIGEWPAIIVMTIVFVSYGTAGGLFATVMTEAIQGILIILMSIMIVPFGLIKIGGFEGLHQNLDPSKFNISAPTELNLLWIIAASIAGLISVVAGPTMMETNSSGKTEMEGRIGVCYGGVLKRFCALGWMLSGVILLALINKGLAEPIPDGHRELAFGAAIRTLLPTGFVGLMLSAILAAQMSTLSAYMIASSALVSRNVYQRYINPAASDGQILKLARIAGLVVVALGVGVAGLVSDVADALIIMIAINSFLGLAMWFAVLWKKASSAGVWASIIVMIPIWLILGPMGLKLHDAINGPIWLGIYGSKANLPYLLLSYLPAGIFTFIVASLLAKPMNKKKIDDFYLLITTPVGKEQVLIDNKVDMVYVGNSKGNKWEMKNYKMVDIVGFIIATIISLSFLGILYFLANLGK